MHPATPSSRRLETFLFILVEVILGVAVNALQSPWLQPYFLILVMGLVLAAVVALALPNLSQISREMALVLFGVLLGSSLTVWLTLALSFEWVNCTIAQTDCESGPFGATPTPVFSTPTPSVPPATHSSPHEGPTPTPVVSHKDGMHLLPVAGGRFLMGGLEAEGEHPDHISPTEVTVESFWIDRTEVTNSMYQRCVQEGFCGLPGSVVAYSDPARAHYPVVYVTWQDAAAYCDWAGRRLPTEAEWERAARGPKGERYPWGNAPPTGARLNFCDHDCLYNPTSAVSDGFASLAPVGQYPLGASPVGALDMLGNVWEWVLSSTDESDPLMRGLSFKDDEALLTVAYRRVMTRQDHDEHIGFRCVISP